MTEEDFDKSFEIRLEELELQGFDKCEPDRGNDQIGVGCSQCEALVINGVATHERGCPNGYKAILRQEQEEREELDEFCEHDFVDMTSQGGPHSCCTVCGEVEDE